MSAFTGIEDSRLRILMLEDNPVDAELNEYELRKGGIVFSARRVDTREGFERELKEFRPQIILSDFELPAFDGISAMLVAESQSPDVPFIFVTGVMGEEMAIDFLKRGATDYVLKDRLSRLVPAVKRAMEEVDERSERRRAQAALRESEERYRTIFESTGTAMCIMDEGGTISFVNREFGRMTGWTTTDDGGLRINDLLGDDPVESESMLRYHREVLAGGHTSPLHFETRVVSRKGNIVEVLASINLLPGTRRSIVSFIDVSREKSYEEELKDRAERLREFMAIASHELRQPITIIKGYTATLAEYTSKLSGDAVLEIYDTMDNSAERLTRIVDELMDVSRIEKQEVVLERSPAVLRHMIDEAVQTIRSRGADNAVNVQVSPADLSIAVDPAKVCQLFVILLENAVNFSPSASEVDVSAGITGSGILEVRVMDRGPGIPAEDSERVFERFFQVDDVLHHSKPGVGLGLYIAREIVSAHGGALRYESREGGGSTFRFTIPV